MGNTGLNKVSKQACMLGMLKVEAFGVKLNAAKPRKHVAVVRTKFGGFDHPIRAMGNGTKRLGQSMNRLVVRTIDPESLSLPDMGQL